MPSDVCGLAQAASHGMRNLVKKESDPRKNSGPSVKVGNSKVQLRNFEVRFKNTRTVPGIVVVACVICDQEFKHKSIFTVKSSTLSTGS